MKTARLLAIAVCILVPSLAAAQGGKDPFKTRTGDFERHYVLEGPNEVMPYRVTYLEIPGGSHTDVVAPNLPKAFEFLAAQKKASPVATQQQ